MPLSAWPLMQRQQITGVFTDIEQTDGETGESGGLLMRATADGHEAAVVSGINVNVMNRLAWAIDREFRRWHLYVDLATIPAVRLESSISTGPRMERQRHDRHGERRPRHDDEVGDHLKDAVNPADLVEEFRHHAAYGEGERGAELLAFGPQEVGQHHFKVALAHFAGQFEQPQIFHRSAALAVFSVADTPPS